MLNQSFKVQGRYKGIYQIQILLWLYNQGSQDYMQDKEIVQAEVYCEKSVFLL